MAPYMDPYMRSSVLDVLPLNVKRSMTKFGNDLATARRKRGLTTLTVAERMGVAKNTYLRVEKRDPSVGLGVYAMALFVLGFGDPLGNIIEVSRDDTALMLNEERLPKRVRMKKPGKSKLLSVPLVFIWATVSRLVRGDTAVRGDVMPKSRG